MVVVEAAAGVRRASQGSDVSVARIVGAARLVIEAGAETVDKAVLVVTPAAAVVVADLASGVASISRACFPAAPGHPR